MEITQYIVLAQKLGTPYVRVLADLHPEAEGEVDDNYVADVLHVLGVIAEGFGVTLLVETNGVYADTKRLRKLLDTVNCKGVAALWDMHHPYRYMGESPAETVQNLGDYIRHVHVKDSKIVNGALEYRMMGDGDLPLHQMFDALLGIGYEGYIVPRVGQALVAGAFGRRRRLPALCRLHARLPRRAPRRSAAAEEPHRHRRIRLAEGDADRPDLPGRARQDGREIPGPAVLPLHGARLCAHL